MKRRQYLGTEIKGLSPDTELICYEIGCDGRLSYYLSDCVANILKDEDLLTEDYCFEIVEVLPVL